MPPRVPSQTELDSQTSAFYCRVVTALRASGIPFLVGGAYALARYTGIVRHTRDFDVFVHPTDCVVVLDALAAAGYQTELTFPHWLGKAFCRDSYVDVIFSGGNGIARVDHRWFEHAIDDEVLGIPVRLCPVEEMIWSKGFILERERYDGADIAHLLRARASQLDWPRLVERFGRHWRILLAHLVLFGFIYPGERAQVPAPVLDELIGRLRDEADRPAPANHLCQGTLTSRAQYLVDIERWGYRDARLLPEGKMSAEEIATWTAAIEKDAR